VVLPISCGPLADGAPYDAETIRAIGERKVLSWLEQMPPRFQRITSARLPWHTSYAIMTQLAAYEGTGNVRFLHHAIQDIDYVLRLRDDRRGIRDHVRGRVMPSWCSVIYTEGRPYCFVTHAGMITFPIARCANLIRRSEDLNRRFGNKANEYTAAVAETVAAFENDWREGGYYVEPYYDPDEPLPFNASSAMGRTFVQLWLLTGRSQYRERAEAIARFFKRYLRRDGRGYVWSYRASGGRAEDLLHAAISVDFAFQCYRSKLVFDKVDMGRFVQTFMRVKKDGGFSENIDGTGTVKYTFTPALWGRLGFVDAEVARALFAYYTHTSATRPIGEAYVMEAMQPMRFEHPLVISGSGIDCQ